MPLACGLHPEFGYVGSPGLRRRLGRGLAFAVFGLLAAAGGVGVFMADPDPDPDPMHAMALAPVEAPDNVTGAPPTATAETGAAKAALAQKTYKEADAIKSPCRENSTEQGDCGAGKARKSRIAPAVNERPAIAAVLIGHGEGPAVLPSEPEIPVAAATPDIPDALAQPVDVAEPAPASGTKESPAPAASAKKLRTRSSSLRRRDRDDSEVVRRRDRDDDDIVQRRGRDGSNSVRRRDRDDDSRSYSDQDGQGGFARLW